MRPYELMVMLPADLEDHKPVLEQIGEVVQELGGQIAKLDLWGKRRLAYPIDKKTEGYYALYIFELEPTQVNELERLIKLRSDVTRHLVVRRDEK